MTDLGRAGVAVLGAGIQGCSVALELASRGHHVSLIDQDDRPMNRASLRNEGKIHLGFVYGNEPSLATAKLQLRGALQFGPLLEKWTGSAFRSVNLSQPFMYVVASDSMVAASDLRERYEMLDAVYTDTLQDYPDATYLGLQLSSLLSRKSKSRHTVFKANRIDDMISTEERAIDTEQMSLCVRQAVEEHPLITVEMGRKVEAVERVRSGIRVGGEGSLGSWTICADQVVNATWTSRVMFDEEMGLSTAPGWVYRLKYRVIAKLPPHLHDSPSATMVLGRYGDVVVRPGGTAYLSWYPSGMRGWNTDVTPPCSWNDPCRGVVDAALAKHIADQSIHEIDKWYDGISSATPLVVDAGVIVAHGTSDIDDPDSVLHSRTQVGVRSIDGYHSMDAGKLTTAPMFALEVADHVCDY